MFADTSSIRDLAADLRARAEEIRAEAGRLVSCADATGWTGIAADAMRQHTRDRAAALERTAALHDDAADALERHASAVDGAVGLVDDVLGLLG